MLKRAMTVTSLASLVAAAGCSTSEPFARSTQSPHVVCASAPGDADCRYFGVEGLQKAVDDSSVGAEIHLRAGVYRPTAFRDVPFQQLTVRGALVVDGKTLSISADPGVVLKGVKTFPVSAIIIRESTVTISGLHISDFYYREPEDDVYDGHGIFTIDSDVSLENVKIAGVSKMALTGREKGQIKAQNLQIVSSHLGIWLEEDARVTIRDSLIKGSDSAAVAVYGQAKADLAKTTIEDNQDDGLYTENYAEIVASKIQLKRNAPYAARAADNSQIVICYSEITDNSEDVGVEGQGQVHVDDLEKCPAS